MTCLLNRHTVFSFRFSSNLYLFYLWRIRGQLPLLVEVLYFIVNQKNKIEEVHYFIYIYISLTTVCCKGKCMHVSRHTRTLTVNPSGY